MNTNIEWEEVFVLLKKIADMIKESDKQYDYILTIPKGGLIPSYFLAELIDIPVETITLQSYKGKERGDLVLREQEGFSKEVLPHDKVLVVDDIYDSGATMQYIKKRFPSVDTACLYARYQDHGLTFVGDVLDHDQFIDFPWEGKV